MAGLEPLLYSLNFHSCLHMGQRCWVCWVPSHFMMQWMWKQWLHWPHTSGQSSPRKRRISWDTAPLATGIILPLIQPYF